MTRELKWLLAIAIVVQLLLALTASDTKMAIYFFGTVVGAVGVFGLVLIDENQRRAKTEE